MFKNPHDSPVRTKRISPNTPSEENNAIISKYSRYIMTISPSIDNSKDPNLFQKV
jgi:hypothetical protein